MNDRLRVALTEVSTAASVFSESTTDYDQLLAAITRSCAHALKSTCSLSLFDVDQVMLTPVAGYDEDPKLLAAFEVMLRKPRRYEQSLVGQLSPASGNAFVPQVDLPAMRGRIAPDAYEFLETVGVRGFITIAMRVRGETLG